MGKVFTSVLLKNYIYKKTSLGNGFLNSFILNQWLHSMVSNTALTVITI